MQETEHRDSAVVTLFVSGCSGCRSYHRAPNGPHALDSFVFRPRRMPRTREITRFEPAHFRKLWRTAPHL